MRGTAPSCISRCRTQRVAVRGQRNCRAQLRSGRRSCWPCISGHLQQVCSMSPSHAYSDHLKESWLPASAYSKPGNCKTTCIASYMHQVLPCSSASLFVLHCCSCLQSGGTALPSPVVCKHCTSLSCNGTRQHQVCAYMHRVRI